MGDVRSCVTISGRAKRERAAASVPLISKIIKFVVQLEVRTERGGRKWYVKEAGKPRS